MGCGSLPMNSRTQPPSTAMEHTVYHSRACRPCKKRKSRCGRVQPCPACIFHQTQDACYVEESLRGPLSQQGVTAAPSTSSLSPLATAPSQVASTPSSSSGRSHHSAPSDQSPSASTSYGIGHASILGSEASKLPPLADCRSCCDWYMNELRWCLVNTDDQMYHNLWIRVYAGKGTRVEFAFLHVTMTLVGALASDKDLQSCAVSYLQSAAEQKVHLQRARDLILEDESFQDVLDDGESGDMFLKAHVHLLIATYLSRTRMFAPSLRHLQQCIAFAKSAGAYNGYDDDNSDINDPSSATTSHHLRENSTSHTRLRLEIWLLDAYLVSRLRCRPSVRSEHCFRSCDAGCDNTDPMKKDFLRARVDGIFLVEKVMRHLHSPPQFAASEQSQIDSVAQIDRQITDYVQAPYSFDLTNTAKSRGKLATSNAFQQAFISHTVHTWAMGLRCQLLQPLFNSSQWFSPACRAALAAAYNILSLIPLNWQLLQSPWQKITSAKHGEVSIDVAMSVYAKLLQRNDVGLGAMVQGSSEKALEDDISLQMIKSHLGSFATHFHGTYQFLNAGGYLGPWTIKCAELLLLTPIQRSLSLDGTRGATLQAMTPQTRGLLTPIAMSERNKACDKDFQREDLEALGHKAQYLAAPSYLETISTDLGDFKLPSSLALLAND